MGWSGNYCTKPATRKEQAELLLEYFNADGYTLPTRVLKHRLIGSVWYAKVETTREDGSVLRWIAVCLVRWESGMLLRKMMDNSVGPYADDCPTSWFSDVPVAGRFDQEWRDRCYTRQKRHRHTMRHIRNLEAGDSVRFSTMYDDANEWIYTGIPWLFRKTPGGNACRLRNWRKHLIEIKPRNTQETNMITQHTRKEPRHA